MRLTVVGCSGSFPGPNGPASSYLVEAGGARVVVDLGNGALGALAQHIDIYGIDAVLLSHLHPDHFFDLASLYVARQYHPDGLPGQVPVFGPAGTAQRLADAYGSIRPNQLARVFRFETWVDGETYDVGPLRVTVRRAAHPVEAYAMRIEHEGQVLAYSGDSGPSNALVDAARDADLFLCEASFVNGAPNPPALHLTGRDAAEHARRAGARRLVLTHIPPWNDPLATLAEATAAGTDAVELARPGATYDLGVL